MKWGACISFSQNFFGKKIGMNLLFHYYIDMRLQFIHKTKTHNTYMWKQFEVLLYSEWQLSLALYYLSDVILRKDEKCDGTLHWSITDVIYYYYYYFFFFCKTSTNRLHWMCVQFGELVCSIRVSLPRPQVMMRRNLW
jgi:hypothetical protein